MAPLRSRGRGPSWVVVVVATGAALRIPVGASAGVGVGIGPVVVVAAVGSAVQACDALVALATVDLVVGVPVDVVARAASIAAVGVGVWSLRSEAVGPIGHLQIVGAENGGCCERSPPSG